jgi:hypothetical protein
LFPKFFKRFLKDIFVIIDTVVFVLMKHDLKCPLKPKNNLGYENPVSLTQKCAFKNKRFIYTKKISPVLQ